jgi:hypothetical protein
MNLNINKSYFVTAALLLALTACGKAGSDAPGAANSASAGLATNGTGNNYVTGSLIKYVGADGAEGNLPAGTSVTMLETKDGYLHLGVDSDDASLPSEVWVKLDDASRAQFLAQAESDLADDEATLEDRVAGRRGRGGMTYCYRYVKQYLQNHGLVKSYLPGASAWMGAGVLSRMGWKNIGGPANARVNDVCFYHGGRGGNGHAEVRVAGGWYYGYGVKGSPISRANHSLIGCYRK